MKKIPIFLLFFLFSCQNEYVEFHQYKKEQELIQSEIQNFSLDHIEYLSWVQLYPTPDLAFLDTLTTKIEQAQKRVYVEVYIFTEKRLKKALINAHKRWVNVKVLLEKNVYKAMNLNRKTFQDLEKAWISVTYSNPENYALNHTKMMIIDDEVILSTGNYSYSTFRYNREFFVFLKNEDILPLFLEIFENDFAGVKKNVYHPNLVLSPFSTRIKLEHILKSAQKSIKIYSHNFSDSRIKDILLEKQKSGIEIQIIFPDFKKVASNQEIVSDFHGNAIDITIVDKPEIHAKTILVDDTYLYLWSINFSQYSIDKNREIGILIKNENIIKQFLDMFHTDFQK